MTAQIFVQAFAKNKRKAIIPVLSEAGEDLRDLPVDCEMILQSKNRVPPQKPFDSDFDGHFELLKHAVEDAMKAHPVGNTITTCLAHLKSDILMDFRWWQHCELHTRE